jgi:hypothetical protein
VEGSKDIGDGGPMGYVRRPAEAIVGLRFTMPLEQRQARGKMAEAAAETDALVQRRRLLEQQLSVEIANLKTQVTGSDKLAHLAHDEAGLAARMARRNGGASALAPAISCWSTCAKKPPQTPVCGKWMPNTGYRLRAPNWSPRWWIAGNWVWNRP